MALSIQPPAGALLLLSQSLYRVAQKNVTVEPTGTRFVNPLAAGKITGTKKNSAYSIFRLATQVYPM
jgi:hypothetical protein